MNIRSAVGHLAEKSYEEKFEPKENILDCALGRNFLGNSGRVTESAKHHDWSNRWQHPDTSYMDLKQEICKFCSDYADLKVANVKVANGSCLVISRFNKLLIEAGVKVLGYVPQWPAFKLIQTH